MDFLVMGEREIKNYNTDKTHIIISIRSPDALPIIIPYRKKCLNIARLSFHDLDGTHVPTPAMRVNLFTPEDAKKILNFVTRYILNVELIICQCEAGISRSAGVAGALSKIIDGDDTEIFKHYLPNMLVYRTILNEARKK